MGEYLVLLDRDGQILYNAWSLAGATAAPEQISQLDAKWFGYPAFLLNRQQFAAGRSRGWQVPKLLDARGRVISTSDELYAAVCARDVEGRIRWQLNSPLPLSRLPEDLPRPLRRAFDSAGVRVQTDRAEVVGKTGWTTVRLCHIDTASELYRQLILSQISTLYGPGSQTANDRSDPGSPLRLRDNLDGAHLDNVGRTGFIDLRENGFGASSVALLLRALRTDEKAANTLLDACARGHATAPTTMSSIAEEDVRRCFREIDANLRGSQAAKRDFWLSFTPFKRLRTAIQESSMHYFTSIYDTFKGSLGRNSLVTGNLIPLLPGQLAFSDTIDVPVSEWRYEGAFGLLSQPDRYPEGFGFLAKLSNQAGRTGFSIVSLYVPIRMSEKGTNRIDRRAAIEGVHSNLFFNLLLDGAILDSGHWFRDGYAPGTAGSRHRLNGYIRDHRAWFTGRESLADYAVVFSPESQIAAVSLDGFDRSVQNDRYFAWANTLSSRSLQWDAILDSRLDAATLRKYAVVVLPGISVLSPQRRALLEQFVMDGGMLVVDGPAGMSERADSEPLTDSKTFLNWLGRQPGSSVRVCGQAGSAKCDIAGTLVSLPVPQRVRVSGDARPTRNGTPPRTRVGLARRATGLDSVDYFIDVNRYFPLEMIDGALSPNDTEISLSVKLPAMRVGCRAVSSLSDEGVEEHGSTPRWGSVSVRQPGNLELVIRPGQVRYFRSVRLTGCR